MFHTSDVVSTVQQMQAYLEQRLKGQKPRDIERAAEASLGQSLAVLQAKTLLLDRTHLDAKLPESKLRQAFTYPLSPTKPPSRRRLPTPIPTTSICATSPRMVAMASNCWILAPGNC